MSTSIVDLNLSANAQAVEVLQRLSRRSFETEVPNFIPALKPATTAWYNGRERGFALTFGGGEVNDITYPVFVITWAEHRNSDAIVVDNWTQKSRPFNQPTVADFTDDAYYNRRQWVKCEEYDKAVDLILSLIRDYFDGSIK